MHTIIHTYICTFNPSELSKRQQMPDVVGDRRLLRFLKGHQYNIDKACKMFSKFLKWRDDNDVDNIRNDILYGNYKSLTEFPYASKIMSLVPQIILAYDCTDNSGNPIGLERFCFDPVQVLKEISKDEYKTFMMYMLEYKILVLEQLATIQEQKNILLSQTAPYGCILHCRIFRDFTGFGVGHIGYEGRTVITWILEIAVDNYPELLHRSHMINVPWIFNTIWYFVKGMLDENTIKKITINGTEFMQTLKKEVTLQNIPEVLGGTYKGGNDMYAFDISTATSPFYYPGCNRSSTYRKGIAANVTVTDDFSSVYQSLHTLHVSPTTTSSSDRTGNNDSNVDALLSKWTNDTITGSSSDVASPLVTKVFHDSESSTGAAAVAAGDGLDSEEQRLLDAALLARRKKKKAEKRRRAAADAEAVIKSEMRCTLVSLQKGCIFPGLFG